MFLVPLVFINIINNFGTNTHVYPFHTDNPNGPLRSETCYDNDIKLGNTENGILGPCSLSNLEFFHPIWGTCIEFMHSLLVGVIKSMFYRWFDQENCRMEC